PDFTLRRQTQNRRDAHGFPFSGAKREAPRSWGALASTRHEPAVRVSAADHPRSTAFTRSAVHGKSPIRVSLAAANALAIAATAGPCEDSPAPSGRSSGRLISSTSTLGTSGMVRIG